MELEKKLRIGAGIGLYGLALYTFGLMIKEIREKDFLNAAFCNIINFTSGTGSKILIGDIVGNYANKVWSKFKNLPKERRELIIDQLEGFISREDIY